MTAAVFRAEFRRALPVLPWLLGLHALMFGLRTRWSGDVTPRLSGILEWMTWALALLVLIGSIWQDSPSRPDRYLATRPMRPRSLFSAKLAALLLMVALPFVAVEFGTLLWAEQLPRILFLGTAQTAFFAVVAVLAAFPLVGFWRSPAVAFSGLGVAFSAGALVLRLLGSHPLNLHGPRWLALDYLLTPPVLLSALAITGLLSSSRQVPRQSAPLLRIAVFACCVCLALAGAFAVRVRPSISHTAEATPLVSLRYTPLQSADGYGTRLDITPPSEPLDPATQRVRNFTRVRVNGRNALRWADRRGNQSPGVSIQLAPIQYALRQHYGDTLKLPASSPAEDEPASALIDDVYPPALPLRIEAQVKETLFRWQVVADLPLSKGASAVHQESRWTITQASTLPDGFDGSSKSVVLCERFPTVWLGQLSGERVESAIADRFVLLEPSTGKILSGDSFDYSNPSRRAGGRGTLSERIIRLSLGEHIWQPGKLPEIDWSREHRLVILRATVMKTVHYDWSSAGPVLYPSKWLSLPYIESLKSVRSVEPELVTPSDAASVTRNGLGWLTEDLLFQDPRATGFTEEDWIAFFRLLPSAKRFRHLAGGVIPRPTLEREADAWLAGYQVRLPNPYIDPLLELALARGRAEAPRWLKESITRAREAGPGFHAVWVHEPIRENFIFPNSLKSETEVVGWFLAQDPARFAFDPATGKFQLR